jgi:hypothetical protein
MLKTRGPDEAPDEPFGLRPARHGKKRVKRQQKNITTKTPRTPSFTKKIRERFV